MSVLMNRMMLLAVGCLLLGGAIARAEKTPATKPTTKPVNVNCVIDQGNPIDDRETIMYEGKLIGFCCEDCKTVFNKDPKKYAENLK